MKNTKKTISKIYYLSLWTILFTPSVVLADWSPGQPIVPDCATPGGCHFDDLIILIDNLLDVFIWLTIPLATLLFAWIGWDFIVKGDKMSARNEAKARLMTLLKGMFLVLAAWLIVKVIVTGLGVDDTDILQFTNFN